MEIVVEGRSSDSCKSVSIVPARPHRKSEYGRHNSKISGIESERRAARRVSGVWGRANCLMDMLFSFERWDAGPGKKTPPALFPLTPLDVSYVSTIYITDLVSKQGAAGRRKAGVACDRPKLRTLCLLEDCK
ncbi:unnamed protein product [Leptosia nina]|uniref:Uncharacterized protein n=1 Tax=Leptosia nina TaxID=320188 RepID=A0AAV1JV01_9NEOP